MSRSRCMRRMSTFYVLELRLALVIWLSRRNWHHFREWLTSHVPPAKINCPFESFANLPLQFALLPSFSASRDPWKDLRSPSRRRRFAQRSLGEEVSARPGRWAVAPSGIRLSDVRPPEWDEGKTYPGLERSLAWKSATFCLHRFKVLVKTERRMLTQVQRWRGA